MEPLSFSRLLICWIVILSLCQDGVVAQSEPCTLPYNEPGKCVAIQRCRNIYKLVINPTPQSKKYDSYIEKAACTLPGVTRSICCSPREVVRERSTTTTTTTTSTTTTTPRARSCNKQDLLPEECGRIVTDRISHGNATQVFAYPWMAVLQYIENGEIVGGCGGSLINERYVLTAAHCIKTRSSRQLHTVILGEHTKNQMVDCNIYRDNNGNEMEKECAGPVEEFGIESIEMHQAYNRPKYSNDIGLIRLDRDVSMKDHIQPICLPITEALQTQAFAHYIVTGWGTTENTTGSDVLLEAVLNHVEGETCQGEMSKFRMIIQLTDKQLCAQGKGLVDSCRGDSGGPLVSSASYALGGARFVQFGIVTFGIDSCGKKSVPGVYSRVASYMDWILDHIECGF
ncbi:serine protease grass-like isoform X1 [Ochlerotatus camptorhynchus]|uniref:serine protease grass-like isoform X1 n=1 Tax=Ochlerotatus camptorhynchus TaxID=644619 RepID=UPI0031DBE60C